MIYIRPHYYERLSEQRMRALLVEHLWNSAEPGARVREEMCVANCRVDVARIGTRLEGFEIKSDADSFDRLQRQAAAFGAVFEKMTLVAGGAWIADALRVLPPWWGIVQPLCTGEGKRYFRILQQAKPNPTLDPQRMSDLLRKEEALQLLREHERPTLPQRTLSRQVHKHFASQFTAPEIQSLVATKLRARSPSLAA